MIPFSMLMLDACSEAFSPHLQFDVSCEMVDNLRFIGKRAIQKRVSFWCLPKPGVTGFHPASRTEQMVAEISPVALLQRRKSFDRICIVFL